MADVSSDGRPDLATRNFLGGGVSVLLGNGNGNFTGQVYTINPSTLDVFPHVVSINRTNPSASLTAAGSVTFTVTFNEIVTGVDPSDFQLAKTGTLATTLTQVMPVSGSVYEVSVSGITGSGSIGLNLVDNGSIHDFAGNPLVPSSDSVAFTSAVNFTTGTGPISVAVADVNGDGIPDLVVANIAAIR